MTVQQTLDDRKGRYGDFKDHAAMAQNLLNTAKSDAVTRQVQWVDLTDVKKHAITYILDKVARIMTGDPEYADNWHDIAGYATLAEERCVDPTMKDHPTLFERMATAKLPIDPVMPEVREAQERKNDQRAAGQLPVGDSDGTDGA